MIIAEGFALFFGMIGLTLIIYALLRIIISIVQTAIDPDDGLHAFNESFGSDTWEDPERRQGK